MDDRLRRTQASWNHATRAHNAHKVDQAGFLQRGGSTLFPEERALMDRAIGPDVTGRRLLHTLCNSGQDTLSWALMGFDVVGVDLADEPIATATALAHGLSLPTDRARFVQQEIIAYLESGADDAGFDVVFGSYGCLPWIADLERYFRGVKRALRPGGHVVVVEFHPLVWSFAQGFRLRDPYFNEGRIYEEPVSDYVGDAAGALSPSGHVEVATPPNPTPASSYQHTVSDIVSAVLAAGLVLTSLHEWPHANGCRVIADLVPGPGARFVMPDGVPSLPLMVGLTASTAT